MLNPLPAQGSREDLFVERYNRLHAWSLQMTEHDHELAEDLLHDLFIQFTLNAPELHDIRNLDAYLYTMLRNLHMVQRRRETRKTLQQLSIVEYDSAEIGLRRVDLRDQIQAQEDLRRVSLYACARKETSKIASVLILRFFHGYYPEEIVKIMRTSRAFIDTGLKLARKEAKAGLLPKSSTSNRLEFINRTPVPEVIPTGYAQNFDVVLDEIRETIFQTRKGNCLTDDSLDQLYSVGNTGSIGCLELSHFVSCQLCLDRVNKLLGLPLLAERNATETLGRDARKRGGRGGRGGGRGSGGSGVLSELRLKELRRRVKETLVHKPTELCVAVNGYTLGSQRVSSERSELNLVVDEEVRVNFVEVFTEQNIRLLLMGIDQLPPDGPAERAARMKLSDERFLDLTLRLASPSPTIQVVYSDPHFSEALDSTAAFDAPVEDLDQTPVDGSPNIEPIEQLMGPDLRVDARHPSMLERVSRAITRSGFWLRPQIATALLALLLLGGFIYLNFPRRIATPSAAELLSQSIAAEDSLAARTDVIVHRTFSLEERKVAKVCDACAGELVGRRRIEVWQSAEKGTTARRLYDDRGAVVAGDWTRPDGVRTLYHHGSKPQLQLTPEKRGGATIDFDSVWQFSPSAKEFASLIGNAEGGELQEKSSVYVISANTADRSASSTSAAGPSVINRATLVKAALVLSKADLHATELTLMLRQGNEVREYRTVEASFERRAPDSVAPSVFEPDPELIVPAREPETRNSKLETTSSSGFSSPAPVLATPDLEAEVLRLLNQAGADMDDQTNVSRTSDGKLLVTGVVETPGRKVEILHALAPVVGNAALTVRIETVAEVVSREKRTSSANGPVSVQRVEVTKANIPVYQDLRRYLAGKKNAAQGEGQDDEEVRQFAARMLNRSRLIMSEAGTLRRLAGQFSVDDLRTMSPEAHGKWMSVVRAHARDCEQEAVRLRQELQPIFFFDAPSGGGTDSLDISDDAGLARAAARLFDFVSANDRVIRSAFTISEQPAAATAIRSPQFWGALKRAEGLAARIVAVTDRPR